jgi:hemolysin activation/secretion protein
VDFGTLAHDKNLAMQLGADYARFFTPELVLNGGVRLTQGLASFTGEPHTRLHTVAGFTKLRGSLRVTWRPLDDLSVTLATTAQYSPQSLIASETLAFGGPAYGRGFDTAAISGSNGLGVTLQPEYRITLGGGWSFTPYPLLDYARTYNRKADLLPSGELISAGVGARLTRDGVGGLTLELAKPLNPVRRTSRDPEWRGYVGLNINVDGTLSFIERNL